MYPVSQAADITFLKAKYVPVGEDQLPMIEQTNEIVRAFNRIYKTDLLVECEALVPPFARLPGIDGQAKMGKSLGNAIYLADSAEVIAEKVKKMYTDPGHIRASDPGKIEGNMVFLYLDVFAKDKAKVEEMKEHYRRGGLGDMVVKKYLTEVLNEFLEPMRQRRAEWFSKPEAIKNILKEGTARTRERAIQTMKEVRGIMHLDYFKE